MKQIRWFDRKFEFTSDQNTFPSIMERLDGTILRLKHKINHIPSKHYKTKPDGKWSIQENVGHLIDLEPLWLGRLEDILSKQEFMRPADLENRGTDQANHNAIDMSNLLAQFTKERQAILGALQSLTETDVYRHALHPRLKTPMRIMDLFLFVAEHDDHHLATISALHRQLA